MRRGNDIKYISDSRRVRGRLLAWICAGIMLLSPCSVLAVEGALPDETGTSVAEVVGESIDAAPAADAHAEDLQSTDEAQGELIEAADLDEYIALTEPDLEGAGFDVNKSTGKITGTEDDLTFEETFGMDFDDVNGSTEELTEAIDSTDGYQVSGETKKKLHVLSDYSLGRIIVYEELTDTYGASEAVVYKGKTLLTYETEEATREGYDRLVEVFGEGGVLLDSVMTLEDSDEDSAMEGADADMMPVMRAAEETETPADPEEAPGPKGWGTRSMYLDYQMEQYADSDRDVTIAVLDTGINVNHEIFDDTAISDKSKNFVKTATSYADDNGHGTMVCGIIAESTASNVELLILKVMDMEGVAAWSCVSAAMDYAAEQGADIINLSLGEYYPTEQCAVMDRTFSDIAGQDILICTASGNGDGNDNNGKNMIDAQGKKFYPAASPYTISVGAIDRSGDRASFSNFGKDLDFVAPGKSLKLADYTSTDAYKTSQGTSFACPYICAAAAFLLMADEDNNSDTVHAQLVQIADDLGAPGKDVYYGNGVPNFANDTNLAPITLEGTPKVTVNTKKYTYDGKVKRPTVTVTYNGRTLTSYDLSYPNESAAIGKHKVVVTLVGNYTEIIKITKTFQIVPKTPSLGNVMIYTSGSKATLKWSKTQGTYQVKIATNKSFKSAKTYRASDTSRTINGLKYGKTYYVKLRAVKKVGGKNYYSAWSTTYKFNNAF